MLNQTLVKIRVLYHNLADSTNIKMLIPFKVKIGNFVVLHEKEWGMETSKLVVLILLHSVVQYMVCTVDYTKCKFKISWQIAIYQLKQLTH